MSENPYQSPPSPTALLPEFPRSSPEPRSVVIAERGTRFASALIDGLFGSAISLAPIAVTSVVLKRGWGEQVGVHERFAVFVGGLLIWLCLQGLMLTTRGQTIGKLLTKIQIVENKTNTLLPFFRVFLLRHVCIAFIMVFLFSFAGLNSVTLIAFLSLFAVLIFFDIGFIFAEDRRCLHDYIAGSKVVEYVSTRSRTHDGINRQPRNEMPFELTRIMKRVLFLEKMAFSDGPTNSDYRTLSMIDSTVESYLDKTKDLITTYARINLKPANQKIVEQFRVRVNDASEKLA